MTSVKLVAPEWEDPFYRFFEGLGELRFQFGNGKPVGATFLWELLLHPEFFQSEINIQGRSYSREDLEFIMRTLIIGNRSYFEERIGSCRFQRLIESIALDAEDLLRADRGY